MIYESNGYNYYDILQKVFIKSKQFEDTSSCDEPLRRSIKLPRRSRK